MFLELLWQDLLWLCADDGFMSNLLSVTETALSSFMAKPKLKTGIEISEGEEQLTKFPQYNTSIWF